ncbi:MAG: hypothetical protein CMO47_10950 [Verrucomicrobiales bacterium]|nr:hypothetical protein [Verrucomicrobiales bacterium]|tara:strand:+ start:11419 stop:12180 length:762 start_codon:yes stop_codon:yes gene_type:complete
MSNIRRNRKTAKGARHTSLSRTRAQTKLAANLTEEQDWYLDTPDVRLTRIISIVVILHAIAIGGMLAFKMVDKASLETAITISSARETLDEAVQDKRALAASIPAASSELKDDVARAALSPPLSQNPANELQYRVKAGDTLPEIAEELKVSAELLRKVNSITSDNELYPGRWLNIPDKKPVAIAQPVVASKSEQLAKADTHSQSALYIVKPGDTAWAISRELGVSFNDLMQLNGIDRPETLQIGQKLKVPLRN